MDASSSESSALELGGAAALSKTALACSDTSSNQGEAHLPMVVDSAEDEDDPARGICIDPEPLLASTEHWTSRGKWLNEQAQVLIGNALLRMQEVPPKLLSRLLSVWIPTQQRLPRSKAIAAVASLLRLGVETVYKVTSRIQERGGQPVPQPDVHSDKQESHGAKWLDPRTSSVSRPPDNARILENLVRLAVGNAAEGRPGRAFERDCTRLGLAGANVGEYMHSRHFAREAEHLAVVVLKHMDAADITAILPGIGIMSDFGLLLDPVSIGRSAFARHDTLLMMCLSLVSSHTGRIYTPMIGGPTMRLGDHGGESMSQLALQALRAPPAKLEELRLSASLAVVSGDGQVVAGGPNHRHQSSQAAERLWQRVHADVFEEDADDAPLASLASARAIAVPSRGKLVCTSWDPFH